MISQIFSELKISPNHMPSFLSQSSADNQSELSNTAPLTTISSDGENSSKVIWPVYVMMVWLFGIMVFIFVLLFRIKKLHSWHQQNKNDSLPLWFHNLLIQTAKKFNLKRLPNVVFSDQGNTPAVYGLFRPVLLLPVRFFDNLAKVEAEHILLHELAHLKRKDLWLHGLCLLLQIVYWFNPLIIWVRQHLKHVREMCCDLTVANVLREETMAYRQTLLNSAKNLLTKKVEPGLGLMGVFEESFRIVNRLKWLEKNTWRTHRAAIASAGFIFITMIVFILPMANAKVFPNKGIYSLEFEHQKAGEEATEVSDKSVIIEPETGIKFTKVHSFLGENDVIKYTTGLSLSPNGKFILHGNLVVPMDDTQPFEFNESATRSTWSPDGSKIAFYSGNAICVVPVSAETARPIGPVKEVIAGKYLHQVNVGWSPDGEKIAFSRRDKISKNEIWTLSLKDGSLRQITTGSAYCPAWSPDGKTIAYGKDNRSIWITSTDDQNGQKILDPGCPCGPFWSPDGKWLGYAGYYIGKICVTRLSDMRILNVILPKEVGDFLSWSQDGKKILFYRHSFGGIQALKIVSASGGPSFDPAGYLSARGMPQWSPDGKMLLVKKKNDQGTFDIWIVPVSGKGPILLQMEISISGKIHPFQVSRNVDNLAFKVEREDESEDIYIIPISLKEAKTTGKPVKVLENWYRSGTLDAGLNEFASFSLDGQKLALIHKNDLWISSIDGKPPAQLTKTADISEIGPVWSPDGQFILFYGNGLQLIPSSGGETKQILESCQSCTWLPNSEEIAALAGGTFSIISISDGKRRQIANLENLGLYSAWSLSCTPDGQHLTFVGDKEQGARRHIFMIPIEGGELIELVADDINWNKISPVWSPDGQWLSYISPSTVKIRPAGAVWEVDFKEILDKLLN